MGLSGIGGLPGTRFTFGGWKGMLMRIPADRRESCSNQASTDFSMVGSWLRIRRRNSLTVMPGRFLRAIRAASRTIR